MGSSPSRVNNINLQPMGPTGIILEEIILEYIKIIEFFKNRKANLDSIHIKKCDNHAVTLVNKTKVKHHKQALIPNKVVFLKAEVEPTMGNQKIKFKTECKTLTSASIDIEQGLLFGQDLKVPFAIPSEIEQHMGGQGGFSKVIHLNQSRQTQLTEVMTWSINAEIEAEIGVNQVFTVELQECEHTAQFTGTTILGGSVFAVYNLKPNGKDLYLGKPKPLQEIIQYLKVALTTDLVSTNVKDMLHEIHKDNEGEYYYKIAGKCTFKYGLSTKIKTDMP